MWSLTDNFENIESPLPSDSNQLADSNVSEEHILFQLVRILMNEREHSRMMIL